MVVKNLLSKKILTVLFAIGIFLTLEIKYLSAETTEIKATTEKTETAEKNEPAVAAENVIADKKAISIEYTLYVDDGKLVDSNAGKEPFKFVCGKKEVIPGLEKRLKGLKEKDETTIVVPFEEAYGNHTKEAVQEISRDLMPKDELKVGMMITGQEASGNAVTGEIKEIKEKTVLVDFNHPLAGKNLTFKIKVLKVENQSN